VTGPFAIKPARELLDEAFLARWRDRETLAPLPRAVLGAVLSRFAEAGGPLPVGAVAALLPAESGPALEGAVTALDDKDLVVVREGTIVLAYPFSALPTAFSVVLPGRRPRWAVCAVDALGVAPLLRLPVTIRSSCHHCREPLALEVRPDGPVGGDGIMVWVGQRGAVREKAYDSL
jgi:hypothetical protein